MHHVGDRHPKQSYMAVQIGGREYQAGCMRAMAAALAEGEKIHGSLSTAEELAELDEDMRRAAITRNTNLIQEAYDLAHGRTPAT